MRRLTAGFLAFLAVTATLLTLPVYAAPAPQAHPVAPSIDEVALGSVVDPVGDAVVTTDGTATSPPTAAPTTSAPATKSTTTTEPTSKAPTTKAPTTTAPTTTVETGDVASSGEEVPGVPALTVSREGSEQFSSVGVTWRQDPSVTDVVVQLRVQALDGSWGDWTTLAADDVQEAGDAATGAELRAGTAPYWTGEAQGVQAIVQGAGGVVPQDVTVALIDPGTSSADALTAVSEPTGTAHAASTMPRIYTRAEWGADEKIRTWDPEYAPTIKAATVHHTADGNNYTAAQVPAIMRSMYAYHAQTRGWGDIGYNVVVDKFGRIFEGRYGGLASTVVGAHAGGFNSYTFGVSMLGNYDITPVPQATVDAVSAVIAWKFSLYGVDPKGTTVLTSGGSTSKFAAGTKVTLPTIFGHRDTGATACPGVYGYARLGEIRTKVAAQVVSTVSAIARRYDTDAALRTSLGAPVGSEQQVSGGYAYQEYANGRLYSSPTAGAHLLRGDILAAYLAAGGPAALGAPTTDEATAGQWGAYNQFEKDAAVYWSAETGAQVVRGAVRARWAALGAEWTLGFPTAGEKPVAGGAVQQTFTNGSVFWSAATGAHELRSGVAARWTKAGGVAALGIPQTGEVTAPGGVVQEFTRGYTISWTAKGSYVVGGGIREAWLAAKGAKGTLGMPQTDETDTPQKGGRYTRFSGGTVIWSGASGSVVLAGAIGARWKTAGGITSGLGLPTGPEKATADGAARMVGFSTGAGIYATKANGTHLVLGGIGSRWTQLGGVTGLGVPYSDEVALGKGTGVWQLYARGKIIWTAKTGAQPVYGAIGQAYDKLGAEWSKLGVPTTGEYGVAKGGVRQDYLHGSIVFSATGKVTVTYR